MKQYSVNLKQEIKANVLINADNKTEAKEIAEELISDSKMQHLIDPDNLEEVGCEDWKVDFVDEY